MCKNFGQYLGINFGGEKAREFPAVHVIPLKQLLSSIEEFQNYMDSYQRNLYRHE